MKFFSIVFSLISFQMSLFAQNTENDTIALVLNSQKHFFVSDVFPSDLSNQECFLFLKNDSIVHVSFTMETYNILKKELQEKKMGDVFSKLIRPSNIAFSYHAPLYYTSDFGTNGEFKVYSDSIYVTLFQNEKTNQDIDFSIQDIWGEPFSSKKIQEKSVINDFVILPNIINNEEFKKDSNKISIRYKMERQTIEWQFLKTEIELKQMLRQDSTFENKLYNALLFESYNLIWDAKRTYIHLQEQYQNEESAKLYFEFLARTRDRVMLTR